MSFYNYTNLFNNNFDYSFLSFNNFFSFYNMPLFDWNCTTLNFNNTSLFNNFTAPSFNNNISFDTFTKTNTNKTSNNNTPSYKIGDFNIEYWKKHGYDHEKGKALALDAAKVTRGTPGQCVGYTRKTINRVYGTNFQNAGAAQYFGTNILSSPQLKNKFRKADRSEIEKYGIPDGAVVLWAGGSPGFTKGKALQYGHGGICYQGKVYSNYIESKHLNTYKEIWVPIA